MFTLQTVSGSLETHISSYSKEAPPWLRYHTVARIKKDDFIRCEKHWKTLSIGASGCAWTPWISFPGRAKLPWNLLLRSLEVIRVGVRLMSWQVFTSGCLLSSAMARLPETGAGWFQQRRCSVATGASGFEFHHFENRQTIKSYTSFAVILSKRAWLRGRHARPYLSSNALSVFSLDLRETLAVLVFSWANRFRIPVWNASAWMRFKIMFATFDSTVQSRVFINMFLLPAHELFPVPHDFHFLHFKAHDPQKAPFSRFAAISWFCTEGGFLIYSGSATQIVPLVSGRFNWWFVCPRYGYLDSLWGFPYLHVAIHLLEQARGTLPCFRRWVLCEGVSKCVEGNQHKFLCPVPPLIFLSKWFKMTLNSLAFMSSAWEWLHWRPVSWSIRQKFVKVLRYQSSKSCRDIIWDKAMTQKCRMTKMTERYEKFPTCHSTYLPSYLSLMPPPREYALAVQLCMTRWSKRVSCFSMASNSMYHTVGVIYKLNIKTNLNRGATAAAQRFPTCRGQPKVGTFRLESWEFGILGFSNSFFLDSRESWRIHEFLSWKPEPQCIVAAIPETPLGLRRPSSSIAPMSKQAGSVDGMDDLFVLRRAGISRHGVLTTVVNGPRAGTSGKR